MRSPLIKVHQLSKTYQSEGIKTYAVKKVSFEIKKGEFVAIMGPSGSGKSTVMQILGFLDRLTGGEYFFNGEKTSLFDDEKLAEIRNQRVGFVFQSFNLLPRTTVLENVELPLLYDRRKEIKQNKKRLIDKALKDALIDHRAFYFSNQLSGGEKQRVAIARALVNNPDIIFADEPTGNLDSKSGLQIMKIFQELNKKGHTIVLVTHETYTAEHAKRILRFLDGQLVGDEQVKKRRLAETEELLK